MLTNSHVNGTHPHSFSNILFLLLLHANTHSIVKISHQIPVKLDGAHLCLIKPRLHTCILLPFNNSVYWFKTYDAFWLFRCSKSKYAHGDDCVNTFHWTWQRVCGAIKAELNSHFPAPNTCSHFMSVPGPNTYLLWLVISSSAGNQKNRRIYPVFK